MMSPLKSVSQTTRKEDDKLHQNPFPYLYNSLKFTTEAKKLIERPEKIRDIFPYTSRDIFSLNLNSWRYYLKKSIYKSYDELPLFLNAELVAKTLGIGFAPAGGGQSA